MSKPLNNSEKAALKAHSKKHRKILRKEKKIYEKELKRQCQKNEVALNRLKIEPIYA